MSKFLSSRTVRVLTAVAAAAAGLAVSGTAHAAVQYGSHFHGHEFAGGNWGGYVSFARAWGGSAAIRILKMNCAPTWRCRRRTIWPAECQQSKRSGAHGYALAAHRKLSREYTIRTL